MGRRKPTITSVTTTATIKRPSAAFSSASLGRRSRASRSSSVDKSRNGFEISYLFYSDDAIKLYFVWKKFAQKMKESSPKSRV